MQVNNNRKILLAVGIAILEGYFADGPLNIPQKCNNPGDMELGPPSYESKTMYDNAIDGWNALFHQLELIGLKQSHAYPTSISFYDFGTKYSGGDMNYGIHLATFCNVNSNTDVVAWLLGA
jgi:hypothetical protein